ncbi:hypothetical protein [Microcystis panniformis]|uniref:Uncharacterized protein n=1 Tax=Microcystis panniformis FACHB-1757 TaxID=1638788 RepID=A0A0K1RY15_9CHRO|nr:hypothetical protein [Microcystis panniformis]AKV66658.1 hypothetical protein VL20_1499 [Microcystis panniformis FACHB-1757]TRT80616.1 MAG: hypothetical protein EWV83_01595 [Microcystis sp. M_OC_Ca_00000000_S217Cul]TRT85869.1 MAG: hypothetical protein EWV66_17535 [Microcystis sp. M_OC_Ca_00000000_C217Col]
MSPFPTGLVFSDQLSVISYQLSELSYQFADYSFPFTDHSKKAPHLPISPRNAHEVVSPHPAFKQDLRLLAQTSQKMIVSDIGIIWLRKKCLPLPLAGPKIFLSISKTD